MRKIPRASREPKPSAKAFHLSLVGILLALGGWVGCGGPLGKNELLVLSGNSFGVPSRRLCERFQSATGIQVVMTPGESEEFLALVKTARKGDVLITHDPFLDYVRDQAKALGPHARLGTLAPVLAVKKGNPQGLKILEDLAKPGLKVGLTDPEYSTCGKMAIKLLEKKGIKDAVMANVGTRLIKGHGRLATMLQTEALDAAILWNGVAHSFAAKGAFEVLGGPYEYEEEIGVHAMGLSYSKDPEAVARFIAFATKEGAAIFAEEGYRKP